MEENDLFVKQEKHIWKVREVGFLRVMIGLGSIRIEKEKVQEVVDWPVLKSVKDIQKFLGLVNYYKWFVKDFVKIEKLLHEMMRKGIKWNWGEKQQKAFKELKERFMTEPVLVTPDLNRKMRIEVDVSDFVMGRVLSIKCKDEK